MHTVLRMACGLWLVLLLTVPAWGATWYVPHITGEDADWNAYLMVDNIGLVEATFTITLYQDGVQTYSQDHTVSGRSGTVVHLEGLSSGVQCAMVTTSSDTLNCRLSFESSNAGLAEFTLPTTTMRTAGMYFSDFSSTVEWKGIALTNFGTETTSIDLYAFGEGALLGNTTISLGAKQRVRGTYQTWFPEVAFSAMNRIVAVANRDSICGIAISGNATNNKLLFTAAQSLESFTPPSTPVDLKGVWAGTWASTTYPGDTDAVTLHIATHNGESLAGTMDLYGTDCGDLTGVSFTGTYSSNVVTLSASATCGGNNAQLEYTQGVLAGSTMSGGYSEVVNGEFYDQGTWSVTRQ